MSVSELTFIICLFSIQIFFVPVRLFLLSSKSSNIMERISSCLESLFVRRTTILCLIFYTNTLDNILLTSVGKSSAIISFLNIYNLPYVFLVVVFFIVKLWWSKLPYTRLFSPRVIFVLLDLQTVSPLLELA